MHQIWRRSHCDHDCDHDNNHDCYDDYNHVCDCDSDIMITIMIMIFFTGWSFGWASSSQVVTFSTEQSVKQISDDITDKSENIKCLTYAILPKLFLQLVCWACRYCWRKCSFIIEQMQDTDRLLFFFWWSSNGWLYQKYRNNNMIAWWPCKSTELISEDITNKSDAIKYDHICIGHNNKFRQVG